MDFNGKVKEIIAYINDKAVEDMTEDTLLYEELGLNSFEMIRIIYEIGNEFGVDINKEVYSGFRRISDISAYLEKTGEVK